MYVSLSSASNTHSAGAAALRLEVGLGVCASGTRLVSSTAGFFTCRLVGYCKDASTSYTWREMGEPWRYYMNSTSFHQTFSQTVDFEVAYPYCSHVALICNNTNFGGISTGTTSPVGVPQSNWGSYICITKTELPYYEN